MPCLATSIMTEIELKIYLNDKLCDIADAILMYYNPCQIKDGSCTLCEDMATDERHCCYRTNHKKLDREQHCFFLGKNGCLFRNIKCKIWLCETAIRKTSPECVEALKALETFANIYGLTSRPMLGESYVGRKAECEALDS